MDRVYIIAEAGVNHNGNVETAKQMIVEAKTAGADAIKFQTFKAENLVTADAEQAEYQKENTGKDESQYQMLKRLEISSSDFRDLKLMCKAYEIEFLSTPFDMYSIELLEELAVSKYKIPSGEITNYPYLVRLAKTGKDIILSTGMSELEEIEVAICCLKQHGAGDISLLHCTTEYPSPFAELNLRSIPAMYKRFGVPTGFSDHTLGIEASVAAVTLGATIIEKHFTLDRNMEGPDHKASLEPSELAVLVRSIRNIESALGDGRKTITPSERKNIVIARKSIVAKQDIRKGELFTEENITTKRPGNGISPMRWLEVLGKMSGRDFREDELIEL